jgi:hypothetical protein
LPENCWVNQESWFPNITALANSRLAILWTSSTFSLPKSPEKNPGKRSQTQSKTEERFRQFKSISKNRSYHLSCPDTNTRCKLGIPWTHSVLVKCANFIWLNVWISLEFAGHIEVSPMLVSNIDTALPHTFPVHLGYWLNRLKQAKCT